MNKPKILAILCHPDDEVLAAWPVFQTDTFEKHLIITCSDVIRKGERRVNALLEVCNQEEIWLESCLSIDNNFCALPTRRAPYTLANAVNEIENELSRIIQKIKPDFLFTHAPTGEYGHGSHRLLFEIVSQHPQAKNVVFTDMCQRSNHRSHDEIPRSVRDAYYRKPFYMLPEFEIFHDHKLDMDFYNRTKAIYDKTQSWTWDFQPIAEANLFIINEDN
ncbi:hypothetical protein LCGC14_0378290 [marine sediment metagenome]|uniref:GlcNAc-PI de-N-acetylase n=1 Tax=marine sediment metagenome TaxID=412755 RepID=A0A0F9T341_9ZZZZ